MTHATGNPTAHVPVPLSADLARLSPADRQVLGLLIETAQLIDRIYLKQSNQDEPTAGWTFDSERPKTFYPEGTTTKSLEAYLALHPEDEARLRDPYTMVVEQDGRLVPIPYAEYYQEEMGQIASLLEQAAELTQAESLRKFLYARNEAFRTNQFRDSDIAWIFTDGPLEVTIGPYEDYGDSVLGLKRAFESVIGVVLEEETSLAATFKQYIQTFDQDLGQRYGYNAHTSLTPMIVMDEVFASGEALYDYVPMAYNLPNDRDIHEEVGSKKVFIRNVMEAKFNLITKPIAAAVLKSEDLNQFDFSVYLQHVIGHEASHGLSFRFEGEDFGPTSSTLEECKADVFGMWFLYYLVDQGVLTTAAADLATMQNLTDGLRQIRFGSTEAHGGGALIQLNWFVKVGALKLSESGMDFDPSQFKEAIESLGDQLFELTKHKDKKAGNAFATEWAVISEGLEPLLPRFAGIPIDIDPVFSF